MNGSFKYSIFFFLFIVPFVCVLMMELRLHFFVVGFFFEFPMESPLPAHSNISIVNNNHFFFFSSSKWFLWFVQQFLFSALIYTFPTCWFWMVCSPYSHIVIKLSIYFALVCTSFHLAIFLFTNPSNIFSSIILYRTPIPKNCEQNI